MVGYEDVIWAAAVNGTGRSRPLYPARLTAEPAQMGLINVLYLAHTFGNPPSLTHIRKRSLPAPEQVPLHDSRETKSERAPQFRLTKLRVWLACLFNLYCRQQVGCVRWAPLQSDHRAMLPILYGSYFFNLFPLACPDGASRGPFVRPMESGRLTESAPMDSFWLERGRPSLLDVSTLLKWRFSRRADLIY